MHTVQIRTWQLVASVALATLIAGIAVGRYIAPQGKPPGRAVDLGNGVTVYVPKKAEQPIQERRDTADAQAHLRAAIPAIEAYSADHNGYAGVSLHALAQYDAGIGNSIRFAFATKSTYCIESTVGSKTYSKDGPGGDLLPRHCPRR